MGPDAMILVFWMLNFKPTFHFPLSLSWKFFSSSSLSANKGGIICISEVIDISPGLIPACASSSPEFHMMYSAYKLNK